MYLFEIHGAPIPQKQTRCRCIANRPQLWDPGKKDKEKIQWQARPFAPSTPLKGAIEMTLVFFLPIPQGTSKKLRNAMINRVILHKRKPDFDNLAYLITNALKEIFYEDDSQIYSSHIYKFYGEDPKTVVKIREIEELQPYGHNEITI